MSIDNEGWTILLIVVRYGTCFLRSLALKIVIFVDLVMKTSS